MSDAIKLTGTEELLKKMSKLPQRIQNEVALESLVVCIMPVVETAKGLVEVDTGALKESIGYRLRRYKGGKHLFVVVGARRGRFGPDNDQPSKRAHLLEFGFTHAGKKGVEVKAKPFIRPTWMKHRNSFLAQFGREFSRRLDKVIAARSAKKRKTS